MGISWKELPLSKEGENLSIKLMVTEIHEFKPGMINKQVESLGRVLKYPSTKYYKGEKKSNFTIKKSGTCCLYQVIKVNMPSNGHMEIMGHLIRCNERNRASLLLIFPP